MAKGRAKDSSNASFRRQRPALSPEARENQMISLAEDLAEQQLLDGTASSQLITHYLKLGTKKAELEREKLKLESELLKAKTEAIKSSERAEELFKNALDAMRNYSGQNTIEEYPDEY